MNQRYKVVKGSQSGHCCFEATVVDTTQPTILNGQWFNEQYAPVCECFDEEDAIEICARMNGEQPCT